MDTSVDWHLVCLVCLQEGIMHSIYDEDETGLKLNEKIKKCTNIDFSLESDFPEQICDSCLSDLTAAFRFRTNCENSQQIIKSLFVDDGKESGNELDEIKPDNIEKLDSNSILLTPKKRYTKDAGIRTKINIKQEVSQDEYEEENEPLNNIDDDLDEDIFPNLTEFLKKKANQTKNLHSSSSADTYITKTKTRSKVKPPKRYIDSPEPKRRMKRDDTLSSIVISKNPKRNKKNESESPRIPKTSSLEYIDKNEKLVCELCGNTYKHANALRVHMLRHENVRKFQCELCPKAFVADTDLKRHMRVHTGEKPYACKFCDRRFSDFGSRGKHERTHTGERPYKCQRCNKSFSYSHVLNVHQLVHTGIKKFKCNICEKGFTKKLYLDNHMKNHACEMQYEAHEIKGNLDDGKEIKLDVDSNYEPDLSEALEVQVQQSTAQPIQIRGQQKSVFTIVKTESGLAEVQYYLPVVD
ncbi:zinc finger protein 483-like [Condylostylus longicornis]|uniref:zinc finger protein 483-like n=1 Tax=Condylostylus longicornis TaxID=2530218 RepID=UPI00244DECA7|nr:zinc finger protein 483-like [Condylostylus longicornis]